MSLQYRAFALNLLSFDLKHLVLFCQIAWKCQNVFPKRFWYCQHKHVLTARQNNQICFQKHGWKCPSVAIKFFCFSATNTSWHLVKYNLFCQHKHVLTARQNQVSPFTYVETQSRAVVTGFTSTCDVKKVIRNKVTFKNSSMKQSNYRRKLKISSWNNNFCSQTIKNLLLLLFFVFLVCWTACNLSSHHASLNLNVNVSIRLAACRYVRCLCKRTATNKQWTFSDDQEQNLNLRLLYLNC